MNRTKWLAIVAVVLAAGLGLMLKGAGPAAPSAGPATAPAVVAVPATRPAGSARPLASSNDNSSSRSRSGRRGRGGNTRGDSAIASDAPGADPYGVLQTRSIFVKGNQTVAADSRSAFIPPSGPLGGKPESSLVFNGVIVVNDEADALVEDLSTHEVVKVRTGDAIAGGKVSGISFDDLAYLAKGRTLHVTIGQNLEGVTADTSALPPSPAISTPTAPAAGGGAPQPVGTPAAVAPAVPGETSTDDILAKMKARRAAEQSGGK